MIYVGETLKDSLFIGQDDRDDEKFTFGSCDLYIHTSGVRTSDKVFMGVIESRVIKKREIANLSALICPWNTF